MKKQLFLAAAAIIIIFTCIKLNSIMGIPPDVEREHVYIDKAGAIVIGPGFSRTSPFSEGLAAVKADFYGPWGYIDKTGRTVIEPDFQEAAPFSEGLAAVERWDDYKHFYIDKTGKIAVEVDMNFEPFTHTGIFEDGRVLSVTARKPDRIEIDPFREGLALVMFEHYMENLPEGTDPTLRTFGFIDRSGKRLVIAGWPDFGQLGGFCEGRAIISLAGTEYGSRRCGYIKREALPRKAPILVLGKDDNGQPTALFDRQALIEPQFHWANNFSEGLALVTNEKGQAAFIGRDGEMRIDWFSIRQNYFWKGMVSATYSDQYGFHEGLALVESVANKKYGFMDTKGAWAIPAHFDEAHAFRDGLARVRISRLYGFIDKSGKIAIEPIYNEASDQFSEGLAWVEKGKITGYIDKSGSMVIKLPPGSVGEHFSEGLAQVWITK